jgi:hypothetical protein
VLVSDVPSATAPTGGTLERIFNVLKADPVIGFLAITITALATVTTMLFLSYRAQLRESRAQNVALTGTLATLSEKHNAAIAAEMQKRIDQATTVVALATSMGMVIKEATALISTVDEVMPPILTVLERLGVRRRSGTTGSFPPVQPPPKTGT